MYKLVIIVSMLFSNGGDNYQKRVKCVDRSNGSDKACERCDRLYNTTGNFTTKN